MLGASYPKVTNAGQQTKRYPSNVEKQKNGDTMGLLYEI